MADSSRGRPFFVRVAHRCGGNAASAGGCGVRNQFNNFLTATLWHLAFPRATVRIIVVRSLRFIALIWGIFLLAAPVWANRAFTVMAYNVENLTGVDGHTASADYRPIRYTRQHLLTKMNNIVRVMQAFEEGRGPDIILFQEFERDFRNLQYVYDYDGMLRRYADMRIEDMLGINYNADIAKIPIEGLLLKTFFDRGLTGYRVASADDAVLQDARRYVSHINVVFTRFPIGAIRTYPIPGSPAIMEVQVEVEGYPLYLFNNHWKTDAEDRYAEKIRSQAAQVLRTRLDEIFSVNANADVIIGGDFNCFYDQKLRFQWRQTALQDVLKVRGDEMLLRSNTIDLYNLWYELPPSARGSEVYHDRWATFMQLMVSRGLYDFRGVQYIDNSFGVAAYEGLNATPEGKPVSWSFKGAGQGFSEHFPIYARFMSVRNNRTDQFVRLMPNIALGQ